MEQFQDSPHKDHSPVDLNKNKKKEIHLVKVDNEQDRCITNLLLFAPIYTPIPVEINSSACKT
ncbi:hypothetical protein Ahy_A08g037740 isoform E [Arachis hypogaea]|uniref:Uncharacterized protein n=1 Tax=Arachis hypogaea TaxID=3818 RepID=A0A445BRN3_ARAHY|nr:hypothetical protein Ahy_A08g037740 isoform E [Arachis hypogaea]